MICGAVGVTAIYLRTGSLAGKKVKEADTYFYIVYFFKLIGGTLVFIFLYPAQCCKLRMYPTKTLATDFVHFAELMGMCTYFLFLLSIANVSTDIYYFITKDYYKHTIIVILECITIIHQWYLIVYRVCTKQEDFWMASYGDRDTTNKDPVPEVYKYDLSDYVNCEANCSGNICKKMIFRIMSFLWWILEWFSFMIFGIIVGISFILGLIVFISQYLCCCSCRLGCGKECFCQCRSWKSLCLDYKRYSYFIDYVLFQIILYTLRIDKLFGYFVQNTPFKRKTNSMVIFFFQCRYFGCNGVLKCCCNCFKFFGRFNGLPNYDLVTPNWTNYRVLTEAGRRTYTRWIPEKKTKNEDDDLPTVKNVETELIVRPKHQFIIEDAMYLSTLAPFYVRFFTHQFANTRAHNLQKVNQPVGINLAQIYGSNKKNEIITRITEKREQKWRFELESDERHLLRYDIELKKKTGLEFPPIGTSKFDPNVKIFITPYTAVQESRQFSTSSIDYYVIYILFFRHHNYIARSLKKQYKDKYSLDQIFDMAKMINILCSIKATLALYGDIGVVQSTVPSNFSVYDFDNLLDGDDCLLNLCNALLFGTSAKAFPTDATNIPLEFNLMYRWHQLIPDKIEIKSFQDVKNGTSKKTTIKDVKKKYSQHESYILENSNKTSIDMSTLNKDDPEEKKSEEQGIGIEIKEKPKWFQMENPVWDLNELTELSIPYPNAVNFLTQPNGVETLLYSVSNTPTGKLTLQNTEQHIARWAERATIGKSRKTYSYIGLDLKKHEIPGWNLASFNDYREYFGFERYKSYAELTDNKDLQKDLEKVYGKDGIDKVEYYIGLWAEQKLGNALHGTFTTAIFASTVITLLTCTPLIRKPWSQLLTPLGRQIAANFRDIGDLVELHTKLSRWDIGERLDDN